MKQLLEVVRRTAILQCLFHGAKVKQKRSFELWKHMLIDEMVNVVWAPIIRKYINAGMQMLPLKNQPNKKINTKNNTWRNEPKAESRCVENYDFSEI